jgi:hypothetical protein
MPDYSKTGKQKSVFKLIRYVLHLCKSVFTNKNSVLFQGLKSARQAHEPVKRVIGLTLDNLKKGQIYEKGMGVNFDGGCVFRSDNGNKL